MLIYREVQNGEAPRYRDGGEMGEGPSPSSHFFFPSSLPLFLMLRGFDAEGLLPLYMGSIRELLQIFWGVLKVFKLFVKKF